jgi:hypothetical protein
MCDVPCKNLFLNSFLRMMQKLTFLQKIQDLRIFLARFYFFNSAYLINWQILEQQSSNVRKPSGISFRPNGCSYAICNASANNTQNTRTKHAAAACSLLFSIIQTDAFAEGVCKRSCVRIFSLGPCRDELSGYRNCFWTSELCNLQQKVLGAFDFVTFL